MVAKVSAIGVGLKAKDSGCRGKWTRRDEIYGDTAHYVLLLPQTLSIAHATTSIQDFISRKFEFEFAKLSEIESLILKTLGLNCFPD